MPCMKMRKIVPSSKQPTKQFFRTFKKLKVYTNALYELYLHYSMTLLDFTFYLTIFMLVYSLLPQNGLSRAPGLKRSPAPSIPVIKKCRDSEKEALC